MHQPTHVHRPFDGGPGAGTLDADEGNPNHSGRGGRRIGLGVPPECIVLYGHRLGTDAPGLDPEQIVHDFLRVSARDSPSDSTGNNVKRGPSRLGHEIGSVSATISV